METQVQRPLSQTIPLPFAPGRHAPCLLGRIGPLDVRLAATRTEIEAAQRLRYKVFVEEMGARLPLEAMQQERDFDIIDRYCDHLLVLDTALGGDPETQIVGTYRLLRQDVAERHDGFYSQSEFDVADLAGRHGASVSSSSAAPACCRPTAPGGRWKRCGRGTGPMRSSTGSM
jgi:putative hemolysin